MSTDYPGVDRREFHKLSIAAFAGLTAGWTAGCGQPAGSNPAGAPVATSPSTGTMANAPANPEQILLDEPHVCRGLNACKGLGRSKDNACAGQGTCASVAEHACGGHNECKGQGGCGENPGSNGCKGLGNCHVPLMDDVWEKARKAFEAAMKKNGKDVGAAPAKAA